ncbi:M14-type cytosolic carboxypeptidase [Uliginosibacterium sp. sgz301328]|uniref:M14 family metallopeptidase n=1 Tax=Uliginosibacterium sp. sgz301328 TaxID=3243764 RepID=UPI00359E9681
MEISSQFDSGNIEVISAHSASDIHLAIRRDTNSDFSQWFHFRISGVAGRPLRISIDNAGDCSYADGWYGYQCAASYDRSDWFRIAATRYDGQRLMIDFTPERDTVWLAYFQPYSHERHQDFIGRCAASLFARIERLGSSVEGRDIDLVRVGEPAFGRKNVWMIARQHPGESMAEWLVEGFLARLLDPFDGVAREIRERACLYVVPNVNPDGAFNGNLRANAAGANLNREWGDPSPDRSPEVLAVQRAMRASGVDFFLDIHGDETLPYVFIDGSHMVPGYGERNLAIQHAFLEDLLLSAPDFQLEHGYTDNRFDSELLTLASKWVAHTFNCVGLTLEMPFKDNANAPDARYGWNGARSMRMGEAMLLPLLQYLRRNANGIAA